MLEKFSEFSEQVRTCRQRAEDAKRKAERTDDWASKIHFLKMETRWLALARSYELTGVITANLDRRGQFEERVRAGERQEPQKVVEESTVDTLSQLVWLASIVESGDDAILGENIDGIIANVHSLFAQSRWTGAELGTLVKQELSPYSGGGEMRTLIDGPAVILKPDAAQAMAVALHELATNAAKYGALSVTTGQVRVQWSHVENGQLVLRWTEAGGPPVNPPTRRGFGTSVLETMIRDGVEGGVQLDWHAEGLVCEIAVPM